MDFPGSATEVLRTVPLLTVQLSSHFGLGCCSLGRVGLPCSSVQMEMGLF